MTAIFSKPGICSLTADQNHIIMFDIDIKDIVNEPKITGELRRLQKEFSLSTIYLLKTMNGYHGYCLDKRTLKEAWDILKNCKYEDTNHAYIGYRYRKHWVLRIGSDIKPTCTINAYGEDKPPLEINGKSNAHRLFLNQHYGLSIQPSLMFDNSINCLAIKYPQRNKNHLRQSP